MKKIIALLTVFAMVFAFAACNNDKKPEETQTTTVEQQGNLSENSGEISNEANGENVNPSENQRDFRLSTDGHNRGSNDTFIK